MLDRYSPYMAYDKVHYLLAWGGTMAAETWVNTLRLDASFVLNDREQEEEALDEYAAVIQAWHTSGGAIGSRALLRWVKLNAIMPTGKYRETYTNLYELPAPAAGGQQTLYPNQISLVATLTTGASRGLASRGRLFLPCPAAPIVQPEGTMSATVAAGVAVAVAGFINNLNAVRPLARVSIFSDTREGAHREVTGVEVGRVLDTMTSRRTSLDENRQAAVVSPAP